MSCYEPLSTLCGNRANSLKNFQGDSLSYFFLFLLTSTCLYKFALFTTFTLPFSSSLHSYSLSHTPNPLSHPHCHPLTPPKLLLLNLFFITSYFFSPLFLSSKNFSNLLKGKSRVCVWDATSCRQLSCMEACHTRGVLSLSFRCIPINYAGHCYSVLHKKNSPLYSRKF